MSDKPKGLQRTSIARWFVLGAASLLTVVGGFLEWIAVVEQGTSGPSAFVLGFARLAWVGFMMLCCTLVIIRGQARIEKKSDRNTEKIIEAIIDQRLGNLMRLIEEGNGKSIYRR